MRVSFIIPAYNEAALLPRAIGSIQDAAASLGLEHEIVVVDDASTDATAGVAEELGARVIPVAHRQIATTRNAGAAASNGDLLVFVDADSAVTAELVTETLAAINRGAVGGGARCRFDGRLPVWARLLNTVFLPMYARLGYSPGAYMFCRREAFGATGGFDEAVFAGEEVLFARALRKQGKFVIVKAAVLTSGRKLRSYSAAELFRIILGIATRGTRGVRSRDGLDAWYGPRRADPGSPVDQD